VAESLSTIAATPIFLLSRRAVLATFDGLRSNVFSSAQLNVLIDNNKGAWIQHDSTSATVSTAIRDGSLIPIESPSTQVIVRALLSATQLKKVRLPFPHRADVRFTWGEVPTYELIQSLDHDGYFSHLTAMHLNGLTLQIPKTVYFNVEQPAAAGGGDLSQDRIDRVFKGKCRITTNFITFRNHKIYKLNGANTGRLGVLPIQTPEGEHLHVTNIERTLIDAVVRPVYAGGIAEVGDAFKAAVGRVSVKRIASYLRKLNYTYPYHQAIGFYLERADAFRASEIAIMRKFPMEFDFYLNYQIKNPVYNEKWRLWVPQRF
jgi:hypothetical protein